MGSGSKPTLCAKAHSPTGRPGFDTIHETLKLVQQIHRRRIVHLPKLCREHLALPSRARQCLNGGRPTSKD
eukprot:6484652-Amphidinium_carterae.1